MGLDRHCRRFLVGVGFLVAAASGCGEDPRPSFPAEDYRLDPVPPPAGRLIGVNYSHHAFESCSWEGSGLLVSYHEGETARRVHDQLRRMRERGLHSLRLLVWHMTDIPRQRWGVVPSRGGRLGRPYRSNFIAVLSEARRYGFDRLTVSFAPQWTNSPLRDNYDPAKLDENWRFIRDVRALALEHGPAEVRFDLLNEGAPSDHLPPRIRNQLRDYVAEVWGRYASAYGTADATVSVIAPRDARDRGNRLANVVDIFEAAGHGQPGWYEVHLNFAPDEVRFGLAAVDSVLTARGRAVPLVIGETSYGDSAVAARISEFLRGSERPLEEIIQWVSAAGDSCAVSPPYGAGPFARLR